MLWNDDQIADLDENKMKSAKKLDECKNCIFNDRCPGIPKDYMEVFKNVSVVPIKREIQ